MLTPKFRCKSPIIFLITFLIILWSSYFISIAVGKDLPTTINYQPVYEGEQQGDATKNGSATGNRGDAEKNLTFIALIPKNNFGQTYHEYPTFWFYFGYESAKFKFQLNNLATNKAHYSDDIIFEVNGGPGIFCFQLPTTLSPLKVGEKYEWILSSLNYRGKTHSTVQGFIERTSYVYSSELEKNSFLEKMEILKEGKWYDLLNTLTEQIKENPENKNLKKLWFNLLKDENIALDKLSDKLQKQEPQQNVFMEINCGSLRLTVRPFENKDRKFAHEIKGF